MIKWKKKDVIQAFNEAMGDKPKGENNLLRQLVTKVTKVPGSIK